jgi:S-adenosylmethionine:tRNA ribosyltransferase-isomerase
MRLAASMPPEERGLTRDGVAMLVATTDGLAHARFRDLARYLTPGDLLVVNTTGTLAAAVDTRRANGSEVTVHFSTPLDDGCWVAELRRGDEQRARVTDAEPGETIALPGAAELTLLYRYPDPAAERLWVTSVTGHDLAGGVEGYLAGHGRPIRYGYVPGEWPLAAYQTVFSRHPGSAEMPSAGRPFTSELVVDLVTSGVAIAPITLHAGVASLEADELPLPERFAVPEATARLVNVTRSAAKRIIAVGTTVTRALESAAGEDGTVTASHGWTDLVLGTGPLDAQHPARQARVVNGLITGWHDPEASHLALLEAVAGIALVKAAYAEADEAGYLGHEFGDSCLLLPAM